MSKFFYSENNHRRHQPPDNFLRRFLKYRLKRKAQDELENFTKLKNPYRKEHKPGRKINLIPIGLGMIFVTWLAVMIYLPYFQVSKVSITGLKTIKEQNLKNAIFTELKQHKILPSTNYFLISINNITSKLQDSFPLQSISIEKVFPNELKIVISEKISSIVYDNAKFYYLLDESGSIMEILGPVGSESFIRLESTTTTNSSGATSTITTNLHIPEFEQVASKFGEYPILYDLTAKQEFYLKQVILNKELIATTIQASEEIEKQGIGHLNYFVMESQTAGLKAITDKKFEILLSFFNPVKDQIANAVTILRTNHPSEYVDVRFGERVFWK